MANDTLTKRAVKLKDIKVPARFYQRHRTGFEVLDQVFGGDCPGVIPGGSYLVTGMPGAGKTTLLLQMVDAYSRQNGKKVLFNVGEQSLFMVKMAADRIHLTGDFEITAFKEVNELIDYASEHQFEIVAQDSLQSLRDDEFPKLRSEGMWLSSGKKLVSLCEDLAITAFIINHVTKDGSLRGSQELVHDADAHLHLSISKETGNRVLELKKNRFGPAAMPYEFTLTGDGMDFRKAADVSDDPEVSRANERRDGLLAIIRSLLTSGHKLSGYSHEEEPLIIERGISGGAMRAALRLAIKQMQAEGVVIKSEVINRREHFYVVTE